MFDNVLSFLGIGNVVRKERTGFSRKHVRYPGLQAEVLVGKHTYSICDWSLDGIAFKTIPDTDLTIGEKIQTILKFHFPHDTITIIQQAHIVRTAGRGISAAKFAPIKTGAHRQFLRVLDSQHAQKFMESQIN